MARTVGITAAHGRNTMLIELPAVGTEAPDFTLPSSAGGAIHLGAVLAESHALLVFYPGNNTPG